ncbi:MAG: hypothetical protein R2939_05615 [Kofleriaceae bacterium]
MSDLLDRAIQALRDDGEPAAPLQARAARLAVVRAVAERHTRWRRLTTVALAIAGVLFAPLAWALATGRAQAAARGRRAGRAGGAGGAAARPCPAQRARHDEAVATAPVPVVAEPPRLAVAEPRPPLVLDGIAARVVAPPPPAVEPPPPAVTRRPPHDAPAPAATPALVVDAPAAVAPAVVDTPAAVAPIPPTPCVPPRARAPLEAARRRRRSRRDAYLAAAPSGRFAVDARWPTARWRSSAPASSRPPAPRSRRSRAARSRPRATVRPRPRPCSRSSHVDEHRAHQRAPQGDAHPGIDRPDHVARRRHHRRGGGRRPQPLRVRVHGALAGADVAAAIAAELDRAVELVTVDGPCAAPCVEVAVDPEAAQARVEVVDRAHAARVLSLAPDPASWAVDIALLTGNLVRDEAAALLAAMATPPASSAPAIAAPGAGAAAPAIVDALSTAAPRVPPRRHRAFGFGILPGLSTDVTAIGEIHHAVAVDLVVGVGRGSSIFSLAGVADVERGPVAGAQIAGAVATAGHQRGLQLAGAAAVAGQVDGAQVGGAIAVAGRQRGFQLAGALTVADEVEGVQLAGAVAVARRSRGVQPPAPSPPPAATPTSRSPARSTSRPASCAARRSRRSTSPARCRAQVGVVNVARRGDDGVSIGLINIVPGGRTEVDATLEVDATTSVLLRHGSRRWHNVYGAGVRRAAGWPAAGELAPEDVWMYGLGMGSGWDRGQTRLDLEAMAWQVSHGAGHTSDLSLLAQLRLSIAHPLGPVAVVGGLLVDTYVSADAMPGAAGLDWLARSEPTRGGGDDVRVRIWPSAFVGVRL